jgi:peptidoglycan L-alanyl-D-glutamate endopeptidase CwlK
MPTFSAASLSNLKTCDERLQRVFVEVVLSFDCTVTCGHRGRADQDAAVAAGKSQTPWPTSKHNSSPSKAVDVVPYPVKWGTEGTPEQRRKDVARFYLFAGYVLAVAKSLGIALRWGGDWDGDKDFNDQRFDDLPHFELAE